MCDDPFRVVRIFPNLGMARGNSTKDTLPYVALVRRSIFLQINQTIFVLPKRMALFSYLGTKADGVAFLSLGLAPCIINHKQIHCHAKDTQKSEDYVGK